MSTTNDSIQNFFCFVGDHTSLWLTGRDITQSNEKIDRILTAFHEFNFVENLSNAKEIRNIIRQFNGCNFIPMIEYSNKTFCSIVSLTFSI